MAGLNMQTKSQQSALAAAWIKAGHRKDLLQHQVNDIRAKPQRPLRVFCGLSPAIGVGARSNGLGGVKRQPEQSDHPTGSLTEALHTGGFNAPVLIGNLQAHASWRSSKP
jgi:hypothetical protein